MHYYTGYYPLIILLYNPDFFGTKGGCIIKKSPIFGRFLSLKGYLSRKK